MLPVEAATVACAVRRVGIAIILDYVIIPSHLNLAGIHVRIRIGVLLAQNYVYTVRITSQAPSENQLTILDYQAAGNEALLQCSGSSYCCDTNRPSIGCCDTNAPTFNLDNYSFVTSTSSFGSAAASSSSTLSSSSSSSTSTSQTSSITTPSTGGTSVVVVTSTFSQDAGALGTLVQASQATPQPAAMTSMSGTFTSKPIGNIVGPAVAIPVVLIAMGLVAFLCLRRRRRRQRQAAIPFTDQAAEPMYQADISPASPYANDKSELEGSSPNLASESTTLRAIQGKSQTSSDGGAVSTISSPISGMHRASGISDLSSVRNSLHPEGQPQVWELPGSLVGRSSSIRRLSELPEKPFENIREGDEPHEV